MMTEARLPVPTRQTGMMSIDELKASLASIILRALRGEFYLASVPCEPKLDVTTH